MTCGKLNYWFLALCKKTTAGLRNIVATTTTRIVWKIGKPELGTGTEIRDHRKLRLSGKSGNWDQEKKWRSDRKLRQPKIKIFWKIRKPAIRNRN